MPKVVMTADNAGAAGKVLCSTLIHNGYEVLEAADTGDVLQKLSTQKVDLLVTEAPQADVDIIKLVRAVRAGSLNSAIPIIMLAAALQYGEMRGTTTAQAAAG